MKKHHSERMQRVRNGHFLVIGELFFAPFFGGVWGYRRAVNYHQANSILDDANRLAFVITESNQAFTTNAFIVDIDYEKNKLL